jgi:hypothetical protein
MTSSQFKTLLSAALILGFAVTGLGLGARWWPTLDIVNNGLHARAAAHAKIETQGGPRLGSDHRPVIADIAVAGRKVN